MNETNVLTERTSSLSFSKDWENKNWALFVQSKCILTLPVGQRRWPTRRSSVPRLFNFPQ